MRSLRKFSEFFTDIAFQSLDMQQYKYSIQALSSLIAARKILNIEPAWNDSYTKATGYMFSDVEECQTKLITRYERYFKKSQKKNEVKEIKEVLPKQIVKEKRNNNLNKVSSQHAVKRLKSSKGSYLTYLRSSKNGPLAKGKNSKVLKNKSLARAISKNAKISREHSLSANGFYKDKISLSKVSKSKTKENVSRNADISKNQIQQTSSLNTQQTDRLRRHRPSVEVMTKFIPKAVGDEIITPRNTKLVSKVALVKKTSYVSNERGQSSNYRRIRMGRMGKKTDSISEECTKNFKSLRTIRSNSVQSGNYE